MSLNSLDHTEISYTTGVLKIFTLAGIHKLNALGVNSLLIGPREMYGVYQAWV